MKAIILCSICLLMAVLLASAYAVGEDEKNRDLLVVEENYTSTVNQSALDQALAAEPAGELTAAERDDIIYQAGNYRKLARQYLTERAERS